MILSELWALWQKRVSWQRHVEHIARACVAELTARITTATETMSLAERHGYLHAKATPVVMAHVILHGQRLSHGQRLRLQSAVHQRVVELLIEQLYHRHRQQVRNAA